ncbi:MAG: hypothetical protein Kow00105_05470 [Phycisphaeraceae bacterium]
MCESVRDPIGRRVTKPHKIAHRKQSYMPIGVIDIRDTVAIQVTVDRKGTLVYRVKRLDLDTREDVIDRIVIGGRPSHSCTGK